MDSPVPVLPLPSSFFQAICAVVGAMTRSLLLPRVKSYKKRAMIVFPWPGARPRYKERVR